MLPSKAFQREKQFSCWLFTSWDLEGPMLTFFSTTSFPRTLCTSLLRQGTQGILQKTPEWLVHLKQCSNGDQTYFALLQGGKKASSPPCKPSALFPCSSPAPCCQLSTRRWPTTAVREIPSYFFWIAFLQIQPVNAAEGRSGERQPKVRSTYLGVGREKMETPCQLQIARLFTTCCWAKLGVSEKTQQQLKSFSL